MERLLGYAPSEYIGTTCDDERYIDNEGHQCGTGGYL